MLDKAKKNVRQKKFEEYLESLPEREKKEILSKIEVNKVVLVQTVNGNLFICCCSAFHCG